MNESCYLQIAEQRKSYEMDLLLQESPKKGVINLTLLRFDQLSKFLNNRSQKELDKINKYLSHDMRFVCNIALSHENIRQCIAEVMFKNNKQEARKFYFLPIQDFCIDKMFDGHQKAMAMFKRKNADEALHLYHELQHIKISDKSIGTLFLASAEDRDIALSALTPCCSWYPYPIITQNCREQIEGLNTEIKREYVTGRKVLVCCNCDKIEQDWGRGTLVYMGFFIPMFLGILGGGIGGFAAICHSHACMHNWLCIAGQSAAGCTSVTCAASAVVAICKSTEEITL